MFSPGPQLRAYPTTWGGPTGMGCGASERVAAAVELWYASVVMGDVDSCERLSGSHNAADFVGLGGVFALLSHVRLSLDRAAPGPGFAPGCRGPGVAQVPRRLSGRGSTWRFRQQKRHLAFAPGCLACYTERIQSELTLTGWLFGVLLSTVGPWLAGQFPLSGFTYTTIRYVLSFFSYGLEPFDTEWGLVLASM